MIVLPDQTFFYPTEDFLNYICSKAKGKTIIDCGCGNGQLVMELRQRKQNAIGIDIAFRDNSYIMNVVPMDAKDFSYTNSHLVIIARPSHGEWISFVISKAIVNGADVIYVGLEKNINNDIGEFHEKELILDFGKAGKDNEGAFLIRGVEKIRKFCLLQDKYNNNRKYWKESEGNKWINVAGGWMPKSKEDKIIETVEAESFEGLDWTKTSFINPDSDSGWLDRYGKWYGCSTMEHDFIAYYILKKSIEELEKEGYVRVYDEKNWICKKRLSPDQRNWLSFHGHKVEDED